MPSRSSGVVSRRTSSTLVPLAVRATAVAESKKTSPTAAPGEAAMPFVSSVRSAFGIELREHQLGQLMPGDPVQRLVLGDEVLIDELDRDAERRRRRPLAHAGLQHPELAALRR